ncbi:MAG TPA: pilus assembly protein TadG-related protein [Thermoflexus sp.]|nr:pilus assembly protein TadG-related protein [Thermoflexus sp.]
MRMKNTLRDRGQALVLIAIALVGLLALTALALDGSNAYGQRRRAQNGADAGALAGARFLWDPRPWCTNPHGYGCPEAALLRAVNTAVEAHNLPDTDSTPGNAYNGNVQVFYTDADGNVLGPVGGGFVPAKIGTKEVKGIRVVAWNPFSAFVARVIGQANLRVSAEATAVYQPPISCNGWAIFAGCSGSNCQQNVLKATGGGQAGVVNGNIHSNADINISQQMYINGICDYVTEKKGNGTCNTTQQGGYIPMPEFYRYEDFLPGGSKWNQVDASRRYYFNGSITLKSSGLCPSPGTNSGSSYKLCDGLYVVHNGDVTIQGGGTVTITIVTNGTIKSTSSNNDRAYFKGFYREPDGKGQLLFFSTSNNTTNGAIQLSYAEITWEGLIYAPNGKVNLSGARGFTGSGAIFGYEVDVSGASFQLTYNDDVCPSTPPRLFLFK